MGIVSDYVRNLLSKQVDDKRLVVWFDPDGHYRAFAEALALPETTIARYAGSFFALRREVDHLLDGDDAPRLLVYAPIAEEATDDALIELISLGVTLKPGQNPWQRNTRLAVIARNALTTTLSGEQIAALTKQIDANQLTSLEDVESAVQRVRASAAPGVLTLIFGTTEPEAIVLAFLASDQFDAPITERQAAPDLAALLGETYGAEFAPAAPSDLRAVVARHILCTDLLTTLRAPLPPALATVKIAQGETAQESCQRLAQRWRHDQTLGDAYAQRAEIVERELGLAHISLTLDQAVDCDTFAAVERAVEHALEEALLREPATPLLAFAERRRRGFWSLRDAQTQARWDIILTAGRLLLRADEIESSLRENTLTASSLAARYVDGQASQAPWRELDTLHRELERRSHLFEFALDDTRLEALLAQARSRYSNVGDQLATQFTHALETSGYSLPGLRRQRDVFARTVAPSVREARTAYILVDALRYEMACELAKGLEASFTVALDAAIASVPTITEVGMASLLPDVLEGEVTHGAEGKLALRVGPTLLRDRATRLKWLVDHAPITAEGSVARTLTLDLDELLSPRAALKGQIANADLVVVTSTEIDALAEMDNISLARRFMHDLLAHLTRGLRKLAELGCARIVLAADHGYLFGGELDSAMKIDPPGGHTLDLHRRVWVGRGGAANSAYLRARLSAFGPCDPDLDLATPWGFGAFKTPGGARAYFHGGISLQELISPVMTLTPIGQREGTAADELAWSLTPNSTRITTRLYTVTISGQRRSLFEIAIPPVRLEVWVDGAPVSTARFASYGLTDPTQELQLRFSGDDATHLDPCEVVLEIEPERAQGDSASVHLLDARTGRELDRVDAIELRIGIR